MWMAQMQPSILSYYSAKLNNSFAELHLCLYIHIILFSCLSPLKLSGFYDIQTLWYDKEFEGFLSDKRNQLQVITRTTVKHQKIKTLTC